MVIDGASPKQRVVMFIMSAWSWAVKHFQDRSTQEIAEERASSRLISRYLQEEQLDGAIALRERTRATSRACWVRRSRVKPLLRDPRDHHGRGLTPPSVPSNGR